MCHCIRQWSCTSLILKSPGQDPMQKVNTAPLSERSCLQVCHQHQVVHEHGELVMLLPPRHRVSLGAPHVLWVAVPQRPGLDQCHESGTPLFPLPPCVQTDFHPESWNPMWSVGTILTGLLSFMYDNANSTGVVTSTPAEKSALAAQSLAFNVRSPTFRKLFPGWMAKHEEAQRAGPPPGTSEGCPPPDQGAAEGPPGPELAPVTRPHGPPAPQAPALTNWSYLAAALLVAGGALALGILHLNRVAEQ